MFFFNGPAIACLFVSLMMSVSVGIFLPFLNLAVATGHKTLVCLVLSWLTEWFCDGLTGSCQLWLCTGLQTHSPVPSLK